MYSTQENARELQMIERYKRYNTISIMCRHQVGDASDFFKMFSASKIQRLGPIKMFLVALLNATLITKFSL